MVNGRPQSRVRGVISSEWALYPEKSKSFDQSLRPGEVVVLREDLDFAIAQVSNALRSLLDLEVQVAHESTPQRSDIIMTESSNVNDRYDVFVVENYEDAAGAEKSNWTRVGVAFPHKDSDGLNVELRAIPVSGKLVIRRHVVKARAVEEKSA
jgi:hypothetical protein